MNLTVSRQSGTGRTVFHAKIKPRQTYYLDGLKLDPADALAGYATHAATVDYDVTQGEGPFTIWARDEDGAPVASSDVTLNVNEKNGLSADGVVLSGLLEEMRDILLQIG